MSEEKEEIQIPEKLQDIVSKIENLSVLDLAELVKILEKKFGVSAMPSMIAVSAQTSQTAPSVSSEEKTSFNVELKEVGSQKIEVIKIIRDLTGKGLKESKDLVDAVAGGTAQIVKEGVKKEEAEEIIKKFSAVGAKAEMK